MQFKDLKIGDTYSIMGISMEDNLSGVFEKTGDIQSIKEGTNEQYQVNEELEVKLINKKGPPKDPYGEKDLPKDPSEEPLKKKKEGYTLTKAFKDLKVGEWFRFFYDDNFYRKEILSVTTTNPEAKPSKIEPDTRVIPCDPPPEEPLREKKSDLEIWTTKKLEQEIFEEGYKVGKKEFNLCYENRGKERSLLYKYKKPFYEGYMLGYEGYDRIKELKNEG